MHHARIDRLSCSDSPIHRLDARIKILTAIVFSVMVLSVKQTSLTILTCYAIGPFAVLVISGTPLKFVAKHTLIVSVFILVLAASSLIYDRTPVTVTFGPIRFETWSGLLRCFNIIIKFAITMAVLLSLAATTRFADLLKAMSKLGMPNLLVMQLGFLYRYIFLITDRAGHILRARSGRTLKRLSLKTELRTAGAMIGTLCLGSIDTAARVNIAMKARGFNGHFQTLTQMKVKKADILFTTIAALYLVAVGFLARIF